VALLRRHWFLWGLLAAVALGWSFPQAGAAIQGALPLLVAAVMAISGFTIDLGDLLRQARQLRGVAIGFVAVYLAAPAAGLLWARLFAPAAGGEEFVESVAILSAQAGTLSATVFMTPLVLRATAGREVRFESGQMVLSLVETVLLPVAAGLFLRVALERRVGYRPGLSALGAARAAAQSIILLFALVGFSRAAGRLSREPVLVLRFLGVDVALHATLLLLTWAASRAARLDPADRPAVLFTGSQKTLPNGIFVAEKFFPENPSAALPLVLYHLLQLVADTLLAGWMAAHRQPAGAPGGLARDPSTSPGL
jgi:BASS family bile acid:Na+ symporter